MAKAIKNQVPAKKRPVRRKGQKRISGFLATPKGPAVRKSGKASFRIGSAAAAAMHQAKASGLLDGDRTEHVSFRAPKALIEAAKREAGVTSTTELGLAALALTAQPDPVAEFFKISFGALGEDFDLDY